MYSINQIKKVMATKGYRFYSEGNYNLNIVGVRKETNTNRFDDEIYLIFKNETCKENIFCFPATTDPGARCLLNPENAAGCAILVPGQYCGMWRIGLHKGKYKALVQQKPVSVYRDNNRDTIHDMKPGTIDTGLFGINLHHAAMGTTVLVQNWSAGCQVLANSADFDFIMTVAEKAAMQYVNSFTYTLLEKNDFDE